MALRQLADAPHQTLPRMHGDKLLYIECLIASSCLFFRSFFQCIGTGSKLAAPQVINA